MLICSSACSFHIGSKNTNNVYVVESESSFIDYSVENDKVYILCNVTLSNTGDNMKKIKIAAICSEDYKIGLLKNEKIYAVDENEEEKIFVIDAKSKKTFENIVFLGKYGGKHKKGNRLLPEIVLESV